MITATSVLALKEVAVSSDDANPFWKYRSLTSECADHSHNIVSQCRVKSFDNLARTLLLEENRKHVWSNLSRLVDVECKK